MEENAQKKSGFVTLIGTAQRGKIHPDEPSDWTEDCHYFQQAPDYAKPDSDRLYRERGQIIFLDTPGIHKAKNKLGEYMVNVAERTLRPRWT